MTRSDLNKCLIISALVVFMILAFACSDDKEDEPVFSGGNFKGTYTVIRDFNGDANTEVDTMTFQFLETGSVDTLLIDNDSTMSGATNFCDCVCTWQLVGDSLRILLVSQSDADDICDPLENPAQTYNHFVDGNKFVFVKFDMNTYPPDNTDIYRKIELWIN